MTTGSSVMVLPGRAGQVAAAISPDGRTLVTGREEGLVADLRVRAVPVARRTAEAGPLLAVHASLRIPVNCE